MKIEIICEFHEASDFGKVRKVGDILDCQDDRAAFLIERGLAIKAEEKENTTNTQPTSEKKRKNKAWSSIKNDAE